MYVHPGPLVVLELFSWRPPGQDLLPLPVRPKYQIISCRMSSLMTRPPFALWGSVPLTSPWFISPVHTEAATISWLPFDQRSE